MILLLLACTPEPEPEPAPSVANAPKARVSLHTVGAGSETMAEAPPAVVEEAPKALSSTCKVDIDMREVSHDRDFKVDGVTGTWERLGTEPLIMKDPSRGCPILAPAKLVLTVPAELECSETEVSLNVGCGGQCSQAQSLKGGKVVQEWTNSVNKHEDLVLAGPMDSVELWGEGLEICRIQMR